MEDFKTRIKTIAEKYNWKYQELEGEKFRLDISLFLKDKKVRFQYVYLWIMKNQQGDKIYMNSRVGPYKQEHTYAMIKKAGSVMCYSNLAISPDTYNGQPMESFITQAVPDITIDDELLFKIIFEVGNYADYLEDAFYGVDHA